MSNQTDEERDNENTAANLWQMKNLVSVLLELDEGDEGFGASDTGRFLGPVMNQIAKEYKFEVKDCYGLCTPTFKFSEPFPWVKKESDRYPTDLENTLQLPEDIRDGKVFRFIVWEVDTYPDENLDTKTVHHISEKHTTESATHYFNENREIWKKEGYQVTVEKVS